MKRIALLFPIFAGILFGSVGLFVRSFVAAGLDNMTIIFIRCALSLVMLSIFFLIKDRTLFKVKKENLIWVILCGLCGMFITNVTFNISSVELSLSLAAVLLCIAPVYTVIISKFAFKTPITSQKVICMIFTIVGCIMVSGLIGSTANYSTLGVVCGIISGLSYAMVSIFSKAATSRGVRSFTVTFYCILVVAIITAPFADYKALAGYVAVDVGPHILILLMHSLFLAVLPYIFLTSASVHIDPGMITILASSEPVAAMVFGAVIYAEMPDAIKIIGLFITLVAITILCTGVGKRKKA